MRTYLRGKVTLLFMTLGMLVAIPAVAYAAELVVNAELNSTTVSSVTVKQGETANFNIKVSATGNVACGTSHSATVAKGFSLDDQANLTVGAFSDPLLFPSGSGTGTNCPITGGPYTVQGSISADQDTPVGTYTDKIVWSEAQTTTTTTDSNTTGGKLDDTTATKITVVVEAGTPTPSDTDGDGVADADDNCPDVQNVDQADADGDGIGDVCDPTPNGDNVAPEIASDNATVTVPEGQTATNTGTWSDANAGDTVDLSATVGNVTKNADGTWSWSYGTTDGPDQNQTVTITADDGTTTSTTSFTLTVNNVVPNVTGLSDRTFDEGTSTSFDLGSFTDPGDDGAWTATVNWGDGSSESLGSFNSPGSLGTKSHTYADDGSYTVTVTVTEAGSGAPSGSANFTATVLNVNPVITTNPLSLNGATGTACLSGNTPVTLNSVSFTDAGTADTHIGTVEWGDASDSSDVQALNINEASGSGSTNSLQHTYGPGTYTLTVTITDDDGGNASKTASVSRLYNMSGILSPFNADGSSTFKYGSTVPVKVQITDCNNNPVSGLAPKLSAVMVSGNPPVTSINENVDSTSAADSGSVLRYSDPQYIFNMNTKSSLTPDSTATYTAVVKGTTTTGQVVTNPAQVSQKFALKPK